MLNGFGSPACREMPKGPKNHEACAGSGNLFKQAQRSSGQSNEKKVVLTSRIKAEISARGLCKTAILETYKSDAQVKEKAGHYPVECRPVI